MDEYLEQVQEADTCTRTRMSTQDKFRKSNVKFANTRTKIKNRNNSKNQQKKFTHHLIYMTQCTTSYILMSSVKKFPHDLNV